MPDISPERLEEATVNAEIENIVSGIGPAKPEEFRADNLRIITNNNESLKLCIAELERVGGDPSKRQEIKEKYAAQINSEIAAVKGDSNYDEAFKNASMVLSDLDRI